MAHSLKLNVIAEIRGTPEQLDFLMERKYSGRRSEFMPDVHNMAM
jgi:hypothetical protein